MVENRSRDHLACLRLRAAGSGWGFLAMAFIAKSADAGAIAALVTAVLGVVGTHAGHVAGHQLALKSTDSNTPDDGKPA
jgi:hypothetical protein